MIAFGNLFVVGLTNQNEVTYTVFILISQSKATPTSRFSNATFELTYACVFNIGGKRKKEIKYKNFRSNDFDTYKYLKSERNAERAKRYSKIRTCSKVKLLSLTFVK